MVPLDLKINAYRHRPFTNENEPGQTPSVSSDDKDQNEDGRWPNNNDQEAEDIFNDLDLYLAAKNGSLYAFSRALNQILYTQHVEVLKRRSPAGNTVLHVAAANGNWDIAIYIVDKSPNSLFDRNFNEDTALHLASKAGNESMVKSFVQILERRTKEQEIAEDTRDNLLSATNEEGNTALLEALNNDHALVAKFWIEKFPKIAHIQNKKWESALYLAAKAGFVDCVKLILKSCGDNRERLMEQFKKNSPIQVAVMMHRRDVLEAMLSWNVQLRDGEGRTALHYAASLGHLEQVRDLLKKCVPSTSQRDNSGTCPVHLASIEGHVNIVSLLLRKRPAPVELLDRCGRSILHVAAESGKFSLVKYILNNPELGELINMKDKDGNTALHLATKNWHTKIVSYLTWDKRVDVKLMNGMGKTSLDVAEYHMCENPPFHQRLTWAALTSAGTPRSSSGEIAKRQSIEQSSNLMHSFKERVNTLLLVSTLVATVTFAAGFTIPGAYNNSAPDVATTLLRHQALRLFVLCDSIALHCSIVAVVTLIFAQLGDLNLILVALTLALPLLGIALGTMSMAFTAGVFLVTNNLRWLNITVRVVGFMFLTVLSFLLILLFVPVTSSNRILRYLSYYPFCLMIFVTRG